MEEFRAPGHKGLLQQEPPAIGRQPFPKGSCEAMRPIAELEVGLRVRGGQSQQDLPGVDSHSREMISDAVSGVESDRVVLSS
jgi:hypothetical protein